MRIVKEFNLGYLKATLMLHNNNYTLKIEDEYGEVNYKLGTLENSNIEEIPSYFQLPNIKNSLIDAFRSMRLGRDTLLQLASEIREDDFEEII